MEKQGSDIKLISLSNYVRPEVKEITSRDWVLNGKKNEFYQYILDRLSGSPTNSSIINTYVDLVYGRGLSYTNGNRGVSDWAKLQSILRPKELRKIIYDSVVFDEFSFQSIKNRGRGLHSILHLKKQSIVPNKENEDGDIDTYWFSKDWTNTFKNVPEAFSAFGTSNDAIEVYRGMRYSPSSNYFPEPIYMSGLPYCEMEEEIANLNINHIKNGLTAGYVINIPDGMSLTPEQKDKIEKQIKAKLTGSPAAGTFVLNFQSRDSEPITVEVFPVAENIHKQWQWLTGEATQKILTAHRCTSPSIVGIISSSGFSNTADEMDTAEEQLMKRVIKPKQDFILDAIEEVLVHYGINLDLVFKPLTDTKEEKEEVKMSSQEYKATEEMANTLIDMGTEMDSKKWVHLSTADVDYDTDDDLYDLIQLASTGTARPNAKSAQDSKDVAIRYRYVGNPLPERLFGKLMMTANKLYRKEDIIQMGDKSVNEGFGKGGSNTYSIWLYKGGGRLSTAFPHGTCKHKWQREIYLKRDGDVDVKSPLAKTISTSEARRRGYKVPINESDVSITPNKNKS